MYNLYLARGANPPGTSSLPTAFAKYVQYYSTTHNRLAETCQVSTRGSPGSVILHTLAGLTTVQRTSFYNLSYVNLPSNLVPGTPAYNDELALAIFQTNSISAGEHGVGLFPRTARINHGCSSAFNSVYHYRPKEGVVVVHALKGIEKGEVHFPEWWSYAFRSEFVFRNCLQRTSILNDQGMSEGEFSRSVFIPWAYHMGYRAHLKAHYGFTCQCSVCALPEEESKESDGRLGKMTELYDQFKTWQDGALGGKQALDIAREIWALGEREGYWSERGQLAADAAWVAAAHSE